MVVVEDSITHTIVFVSRSFEHIDIIFSYKTVIPSDIRES